MNILTYLKKIKKPDWEPMVKQKAQHEKFAFSEILVYWAKFNYFPNKNGPALNHLYISA